MEMELMPDTADDLTVVERQEESDDCCTLTLQGPQIPLSAAVEGSSTAASAIIFDASGSSEDSSHMTTLNLIDGSSYQVKLQGKSVSFLGKCSTSSDSMEFKNATMISIPESALVQESESNIDIKMPLEASGDEEYIVADSDKLVSNATTISDGQPLMMNDHSISFIHLHCRGEGMQEIELGDGTKAYLSSFPIESYARPEPQGRTYLKTYACSYHQCGKQYTSLNHLKIHERMHTGDKPFKCNYQTCEKAFSTMYALKSHTRTHTGEKPYKCPCPGCPKSFKTSGDLQKHIRTHTGERPFQCPYEKCGLSFTTSNIRKVHIRTHTGERPYKCEEKNCHRTFSSVTNYKNHVRIHTGEKPYQCKVEGCGKRFTEYSSMYKHHIVHTLEKPYACNQCTRTYRQPSTLALHKRQQHCSEEAQAAEISAAVTEGIIAEDVNDQILDFGERDNPMPETSGQQSTSVRVVADASQLKQLQELALEMGAYMSFSQSQSETNSQGTSTTGTTACRDVDDLTAVDSESVAAMGTVTDDEDDSLVHLDFAP